MSHNLCQVIIAPLAKLQLDALIYSTDPAQVTATRVTGFYFINANANDGDGGENNLDGGDDGWGSDDNDDEVESQTDISSKPLVQWLADLGVEKCLNINTDYFGGDGEQCFELLVREEHDGKHQMRVEKRGERINRGLLMIEPSEGYFMDKANAVIAAKDAPYDLFEAIGLCDFRDNESMFSE